MSITKGIQMAHQTLSYDQEQKDIQDITQEAKRGESAVDNATQKLQAVIAAIGQKLD